MKSTAQTRRLDLEERIEGFARTVRDLCHKTKVSSLILDDVRQLIRASGSVAANYIEAVEAVSPKDFIHRHRICRKEIKEAMLWMRLLQPRLPDTTFSPPSH